MTDQHATDERGRGEKWLDRFAYVFNRISLGAGVLAGLYFLYEGYYLRGVFMFCLVPVYFRLKDKYDAP